MPQPAPGIPPLACMGVWFGLFETGFALFWIWGAAGLGERPLRPERLLLGAFGIPFLMLGLFLPASPRWIHRRMVQGAAHTLYVITDRRAIVFNGGYFGTRGIGALMVGLLRPAGRMQSPSITVQTFQPSDLGRLVRVQHSDGTGDLLFGTSPTTLRHKQGTPVVQDGFYSIVDVRGAERLLHAMRTPVEG